MNERIQAQVKPTQKSSFAPSTPRLLQRKCACGGTAGLSGKCEECSKEKRFGLQTKLKVNRPWDSYEREADRVADQVLATPTQRAVSDAPPRTQRSSGQWSAQMDAAPASVDEALASPGRPLEPTLRQDMEQRFGHDFSRVRVHSGAAAEQSAREVNAKAYTTGRDIVFSAGRFSPGTDEGRRLLSHELAHVVQQIRGGPPPTLVASSPLEHAADRAAARIMQGEQTVRVAGASAPGIARETPSPKPPVPQVRQTPFHFISESPALDNWKLSVKNMLEREYEQKFATFEDAHKHFQEELKKLPSTEAREAYADRMRDRARKNFFRQEAREPSYAYSKEQIDRLRGGAAPIEGQQLEHMEEVKTKEREGIKVPGHPERALDPANIYLTEGGKGGTAPKGTPHAEKWRTIKAAKEKSLEIRKNPPKPLAVTGAHVGAPLPPVEVQMPVGRHAVKGAAMEFGAQAILAGQLGSVRGAEAAKAEAALEKLFPEIEKLRWAGNGVEVTLVMEAPKKVDIAAIWAGTGDPGQVVYFKKMYISQVIPAKKSGVASPQTSVSANLGPGDPEQVDPHEMTLPEQLEAQMGEEYPVRKRRPRKGFQYVSRQLLLPALTESEMPGARTREGWSQVRGIAGTYLPKFEALFSGPGLIIPSMMNRRLQIEQEPDGKPVPRMWNVSKPYSYLPSAPHGSRVMKGRFSLGEGVPPASEWIWSEMEYSSEGLILEWASGLGAPGKIIWDALFSWHKI